MLDMLRIKRYIQFTNDERAYSMKSRYSMTDGLQERGTVLSARNLKEPSAA